MNWGLTTAGFTSYSSHETDEIITSLNKFPAFKTVKVTGPRPGIV